ncbi:MAG: zinc-dependent alcohol dehydrogenase family protein [Steroidobacteraceae bacterium]|jgi:alcohol dehydrogenase|nr:zinc-dependent alcohol dehydrogenase family protein [Steroidobacteraceae bacterium]
MKSLAAILVESGRPRPYAASQPLEIAEVELDPPGPGEVLIEMRAAGLCHSDLSVIDGNRPRPLPMALGHEGAGVVAAVGEGVTGLHPGDHVVTAFVAACGHCAPCTKGRPALCEPGMAANVAGTLLSGARRLHRGAPVHHHLGVSAFARHAVVAQESCVKVPHDLPFAEAAVFGCAVLTGVGAVVNTAALPRGASAAVIGLGGVGLAALLGARRLEATPLVAVDLGEDKLALAQSLGATHAFNAADPDCAARIREATGGGVDFAFEMAGAVPALELAWNACARGGTVVSAGLSHPERMFCLRHVTLVAEERTLKGSYLGGATPARDIPRYIEWYRRGELPVDRLLSERIALGDINEAFDRLAEGRTVRQVIEFG